MKLSVRQGQAKGALPDLLPSRWNVWVCSALMGCSSVAMAQVPAQPSVSPSSDPSLILRQGNKPPREPAAPSASEPSRPALTPPPKPQAGEADTKVVRFVLTRVEVTPSKLLPEATLAQAWAGQLGQEVTIQDIRDIVARINQIYWDAGHYAALASLPAQKIANGVLKLNLVEGTVEKVKVESEDPRVVSLADDVLGLSSGELFVGPAVQARLARFNRGSDTRFFAALLPGSQPGTTEVVAQVDLAPKYDLAVSLHNEATDSLGRNQLDVSGYVRRLLSPADRLGAIVQTTEGSLNALLLYSVPVHWSGLRLGASASSGSTSTTDSGLGQLKVEGRSNVLGLSLTQPLPAWRNWEVDLSLNAQRIQSNTRVDGVSLGDARTSLYSLGMQSVYRSPGHLVSIYTAINTGSYEPPFRESRQLRTFNSTGSWAWVLNDDWWLNTRGGLQLTSDTDVPATVKFSLGNPTDVRGYPASVVFGDKGIFVSLEAHRRFADNLDVFGFLDNGTTSTSGVPRQTLSSLGLGLTKAWGRQWSLSGSLAHPLKDTVPGQSSLRALVRLTWQFE